MTNVEKAASELTDMLTEDLKRNKNGNMIADILRDKSILESEILNKVCEFEEKHKEVEVESIEWIVEKIPMEGVSDAEYAKTMNVKIKISIKQ